MASCLPHAQSGQLVAVKQINIKNTGGKLSVGKKEIDILKVLHSWSVCYAINLWIAIVYRSKSNLQVALCLFLL